MAPRHDRKAEAALFVALLVLVGGAVAPGAAGAQQVAAVITVQVAEAPQAAPRIHGLDALEMDDEGVRTTLGVTPTEAFHPA